MNTKLKLSAINFLFLLMASIATNAQTSTWTWATKAGTTGDDQSYDMTHDAAGNKYVTGMFSTPSITFGSVTINNQGSAGTVDMYIVKYGPNDSVLWGKSAGNFSVTYGTGVKVDANGYVYVTGYFGGRIIVGNDTLNTPATGSGLFLIKYDPNGNALWGKASKESIDGYVVPHSMAYNGTGNLYITGEILGDTVFIGNDTLYHTGSCNLCTTLFIAKYDTLGNAIWAKATTKGGSPDHAYSIATDIAGNAIITGAISSDSIMFGGILLHSSAFNTKFFIAKYDPQGTVLWAKLAGGSGDQMCHSVKTDSAGNSYAAGSYFSSSITFGATTLTNTGQKDIFIVKYNASGTVVWAKKFGGTGVDEATGLTIAPGGDIYMAGDFSAFSLTFGATTFTSNGTVEAFVTKLDTSGTAIWANKTTASGVEHPYGIDWEANQKALVYGYYTGTTQFGSTTLTNAGGNDIFIARIQSCSLGITSQPQALTAAEGSTATFTVTSNSPTAQYQWQSSISAGIYTNITNTGQYSGANTNTLSISNVTLVQNGNTNFRCVITDGICSIATNDALLTVVCIISITGQTGNQTALVGSTAQFSVSVSTPNVTYQWGRVILGTFYAYSNTAPYSGVTTPTISISPVTNAYNNTPYLCLVSLGSGCFDTSNVAILTVTTSIGVNEINQDNEITIYPNPASDMLYVKTNESFKITKLELYSLLGQLIKDNTTANEVVNEISLSGLQSGIYFVKIVSGDTQYMRKIRIVSSN